MLAAAGFILSGCAIFEEPKPAAAPAVKPAVYRLTYKEKPAAREVRTVTKAAHAPVKPASPAPVRATTSAFVGDAAACAASKDCQARIKPLVDDAQRVWILQPPTPVEYATGTRLYAYYALRTQLSCNELALSLREIGAAGKTFGGKVQGVADDQAARVRTLNAQVESALAAENASRCAALYKPAGPAPAGEPRKP